MRLAAHALAVGALTACSMLCAQGASAALDTYQMVRSLQLVQDRIADGDHAALPMQQKILQMIDKQLRESTAEDFADRRNIDALLIYGMSGGNPVTVDVAIARLTPNETLKPLTDGVRFYVRGSASSAMLALQPIDPRALRGDLGSFVALIKGSMAAPDDPKAAMAQFDTARLLGPGTLVEEAALRRSLPLAARLGDTAIFLRAASQYVRRFLRSPYASQFADELVKGIVTLYTSLDFKIIEATVSEMSLEHQKVIYLRLARTAAIEGLHELSDFAARKAAEFGNVATAEGDPRAILYSSLSEVTSENGKEILERLRAIDREKLAGPDRQLLDAAISVASEILTSPGEREVRDAVAVAPPAPPAQTPTPAQPRQVAPSAVAPPAEPEAPMAGDVGASPAMVENKTPPAPTAQTATPVAQPVSAAPDDTAAPDEGDTLPVVSQTRRMLEDIDKMLEGAK